MPITVAWDNDQKTVIRWDVEGHWDWDLVSSATQQSVMLRKNAGHNKAIGVIINVEHAAPLKHDSLRKTYEAMSFDPSQRSLVIVVGSSLYTQAVVEIFRRMYPEFAETFIGVDTLREARRLLLEQSK